MVIPPLSLDAFSPCHCFVSMTLSVLPFPSVLYTHPAMRVDDRFGEK
jgi:hypothetical protein